MATSLPPDAPRPRLCLVRKRAPEDEYGFNLHAEKSRGQFIGAVDGGSPAEVAGLRPGDRIISVNGVSVVNEPHKQVVAKIKENPLSCDLIVIDEDTQAWYTERKISVPTDPYYAQIASGPVKEQGNGDIAPPEISLEKSHLRENSTSLPTARPPSYHEVVASNPRPRLSVLIKPEQSAEFGFNLHAEKNAGHFIGKIDPNSIAEKAGLEEGQRIVGVNGVLIYPHTPHKDVVSLIKANPLRTELLVASPEVDAWYNKNAQEFDFATAEQYVPAQPADHFATTRSVTSASKSNGYPNGDSGYSNGNHEEDEIVEQTNGLRLETSAGLNDQSSLQNTSSYDRPRPPPSVVEPYEQKKTEDTQSVQPTSNSQQPDWMELTAAQLRARVGKHKKLDPRKEQLNWQQKHEFIRNM